MGEKLVARTQQFHQFMAMLGIIFFIVALLVLGVGFAIGVALVGVAAVMAALGVVSSSVAFGIFRRRPTDAVMALIFQLSILGGIPTGMLVAWIVSQISAIAPKSLSMLIIGGLAGAGGGLLLALVLSWILRSTSRAVMSRLKD